MEAMANRMFGRDASEAFSAWEPIRLASSRKASCVISDMQDLMVEPFSFLQVASLNQSYKLTLHRSLLLQQPR
jgi:hypothetical protein